MTNSDAIPLGKLSVSRHTDATGHTKRISFGWMGAPFIRISTDLVEVADPKYVTLDLDRLVIYIGPYITRIVSATPECYLVERIGIRDDD